MRRHGVAQQDRVHHALRACRPRCGSPPPAGRSAPRRRHAALAAVMGEPTISVAMNTAPSISPPENSMKPGRGVAPGVERGGARREQGHRGQDRHRDPPAHHVAEPPGRRRPGQDQPHAGRLSREPPTVPSPARSPVLGHLPVELPAGQRGGHRSAASYAGCGQGAVRVEAGSEVRSGRRPGRPAVQLVMAAGKAACRKARPDQRRVEGILTQAAEQCLAQAHADGRRRPPPSTAAALAAGSGRRAGR